MKILRRYYLNYLVLMFLSLVISFFSAKFATYLPINTENYFDERQKIVEGLDYLITYKCLEDIDDIKEKWICGKRTFEVEAIEADRDRAFSTGKGVTDDGQKFFWVAEKNEGWWNVMGFGKEGEKITCDHIPENITGKMFGGKFHKCFDESGKEIERTI